MSDAGVVTAAEIAACLDIPLDGKVVCKGVRWPPDQARPGGPSGGSLDEGSSIGLGRFLWHLSLAIVAWLLAAPDKPRRPPYASRVVATPFELRVLWNGRWSVYSWAAVRQAARRGKGWRLVIGELDCQLKDWKVAEAVVQTAQMVMSRRRLAGRDGLRLVDETPAAALSLAAAPDDGAAADRGLSAAEP